MPDTIFVSLNIPVDEQGSIDAAIARLQARWPAYEPNDGNMEVAIIEIAGSFYAALMNGVTQMPAAALRTFGTKLYNVPYKVGVPATTTVTFTIADTLAHDDIPAGAQFNIDGYAFNVGADTPVPGGSATVAGVRVYSATMTAGANDLTGDVIAQLSLPSYVIDVSVDAPTTNGEDPQTDLDYLNMFSNELRLRAKTIVTTRDFEIEALEFAQNIGRAVAVGDTAREVNIWVATPEGEIVDSPTKTALAAHYEAFVVTNDTFTIHDPDYTIVNVSWTAIALPGFDPTFLQDAGNTLLTQEISPVNYARSSGRPVSEAESGAGWIPEPKIYRNDLIALLKSVPGIRHVTGVTLSASGLTVDGSGNLTLSGGMPLPRPGTMTGTVTL